MQVTAYFIMITAQNKFLLGPTNSFAKLHFNSLRIIYCKEKEPYNEIFFRGSNVHLVTVYPLKIVTTGSSVWS